jgi:hypothetical protein
MPLGWIYSALKNMNYPVEQARHKAKLDDERWHVRCPKYCFEVHHSPGWGSTSGSQSGGHVTDTIIQGEKGWDAVVLTDVANLLAKAFAVYHNQMCPVDETRSPKLCAFVEAQGAAMAATWPEVSDKMILMEEFVTALPLAVRVAGQIPASTAHP